MRSMNLYQTNLARKAFAEENGVSFEKMLNAAALYLYSLLADDGNVSTDLNLCFHDALVIQYASNLIRMMPNSKFIYVRRREESNNKATMSKMISENEDFMEKSCTSLDKSKCVIVEYEQLITKPEKTGQQILMFVRYS